MQYIDCQKYAQSILDEVKAIANKKTLAILTVGNNPASQSYVKGKIKDCERCGIPYKHITLDDDEYEQWKLNTHISRCNFDPEIGGIIVQLPLPAGWDEDSFVNKVVGRKDVDGFVWDSHFKPCTPEGIMYLLHQELGDLTGKNALVIGRGKLVGKPIVQMLLDENCTVTIAHSKTYNLNELLLRNDIIISAAGKAGLIDLKNCRAEVVIDVGVNRDENGKLCGDCYNFDPNDGSDMKVTPVPKGIGLMTRAMLMQHMGGSGSR